MVFEGTRLDCHRGSVLDVGNCTKSIMSSDSFHILPLLEGDFWLIVPVSMVAANLYYNIETLMVTSKLNYL